jgi:tripartite-type tricarboxylate transporter receptor subunit TctC
MISCAFFRFQISVPFRVFPWQISCLAVLLLLPLYAAAQAYPSRPVRLISPNPAGGANDLIGRIVAQKIGELLGQPMVMDNRGGAGGTIGTEMAARAAPDGYTLFVGSQSTVTVAPHIYSKLSYDVLRDFAPIAMFAEVQNLLNANPAFPPNTVKELIALAKAKPNTLNYGSAGSGSASHFAGLLFAKAAGIEFVHVPYKGGAPAMAAIIAGEASFNFGPMPASAAHIKSGRLKALAVSGARRSVAFPSVPTVAESGISGFVVVGWFGLMAPRDTPKPIVDRLHAVTAQAVNSPDVRQQLLNVGADPAPNSPDEFGKFLRREYERYGVLIREAGLKVE